MNASKKFTSMEHQALDAAVNGLLEFDFKRLFTDQLFEGLVSKGYVEVDGTGSTQNFLMKYNPKSCIYPISSNM